ncbi:MAG TPA: DUF3857 domain-containing protein [Phnomibacter sp.]|nr:DUF3857 domain-containing protein [Phnomibacter sp.]
MRKYFLIFIGLFLGQLAIAQAPESFDKLRANVADFLTQSDPHFANNQVPQAWQDQSAVIIAQKTMFTFDQRTSFRLLGASKKSVVILEKERRKIKLLDQSSVTLFSELYYDGSDVNNGFDGKIIKADGKIIALELEKAVLVEDEENVPGVFRSYTSAGGERFYKVPVNNLEIGDIIDYAYQVNNIAGTYSNLLEFTPIYYPCHRQFGVMHQQFEVKLDNNTYLNHRAVNGAPSFAERNEAGNNIYTWEDANRPIIKQQSFLNSFLQLPMVKFQIVYSSKEDARNLFILDRSELKTDLNATELTKKAAIILQSAQGSTAQIFPQIRYHLQKMDVMDVSEEEYIKSCYYVMRHNYALGDRKISGQVFVNTMQQLMRLRKIESQIGVTASRYTTHIKDIIFRSELEWFIKIKGKLIFPPTAMSNLYDMPASMQGVEAYMIPTDKGGLATAITLPVIPLAENKSSFNYQVSLSAANIDHLVVTSKQEHLQNNRDGHIDKVMTYELYQFEDWKTYGGWDDKEAMPPAQQDQLNTEISKYRAEGRKLKPIFMENQLKGEFDDVVSYQRFHLLQDGRSLRKPALIFQEDFTVGDMVQHAGKSLLVKLPGFLTSQLQLTDEQRVRQYDADLSTARTLQYQIQFNVPAGYNVLGLEDLNKQVDNETGSFTSSAALENNVLTIKATKIYKVTYVKKEDWPKMLEWIDAAYGFSQKRVLLRKI